MGNVNCLANNTDEQELYNDQSPITPSKAALMLQNEFRREKGNLSFRRNIIELINKKLEEKKKNVEIIEMSEKEFNSKIKSLSYVQPIFDLFSNQLSSLSYEGSELNYQLMPLHFHDKDNNESEYYYGTWNIKGETCGLGTLVSANGNVYKGTFLSGVFHGIGLLINSNSNYYYGEWNKGECEGKGTIVVKDTLKYEGTFKNNKKN